LFPLLAVAVAHFRTTETQEAQAAVAAGETQGRHKPEAQELLTKAIAAAAVIQDSQQGQAVAVGGHQQRALPRQHP
jgi:hypothetical protein